MAMGSGPHRPLLQPMPGAHPGHPGLDRGCGADPRRLRHAEPRAEHDPRRRASVRAALRRRFADRDRYGRTRGLAHDGGPRPVGEPAVAAFLGSAAAVAPVRLAGPRPRRRGQHAGSGARPMTDLPVSIADIRKAEAAIAGTLTRTPLVRAAELSDLSGCKAYLKLETLQTTGSFKERGALNKLLTLGKGERKAGVVAMSAGNHAQGVAYHARRLGIPATIVMPAATPFTKIDRTEALGARVVLRGASLVAALVGAVQLVTERQLESAVELLIERQKLIVEGAGAAGVAALLAEPERFRGRKVGIVLTGGNIDARLLASLLMRGLVRSGRLVRLRSELPDIPGVLSRVAGVIGGLGGNIVEVHHQRLFHDTSVKRAELDVVVETQNRRHVVTIIDALVAAGFPTRLLSSSEDMAEPNPTGLTG